MPVPQAAAEQRAQSAAAALADSQAGSSSSVGSLELQVQALQHELAQVKAAVADSQHDLEGQLQHQRTTVDASQRTLK